MTKYTTLFLFLLIGFSLYSQGDKKSVGQKFLNENKDQLELTVSDINNALIADMYQSEHNGVTHIYYNQAYQGIPVYNAILNLNITKEDEILFYHNGFVKNLDQKVNTSKAVFSATDAIKSAAYALGIQNPTQAMPLKSTENGFTHYSATNFSEGIIKTRQVFYPVSDQDVKLAWEIVFNQKNSMDSWSGKIDAVTGQALDMENRTLYCSHSKSEHYHPGHDECNADVHEASVPASEISMMSASYRVYPIPYESPSYGPQELVTDPHYPEASPFGWHDIDGVEGAEHTITQGNNVHAYNDANDDFQSNGDEPNGGMELLFDFPHDPSKEADSNAVADVVNLFYANNMIHDITYLAGFNEVAGNFQNNNYGNGGVDSDYVVAHSLDGSGTNNANFTLTTDGTNGNMNMFKWDVSQSSLFSITNPTELSQAYATGAAGDGWGFDETYSSVNIEAELAPAYDNNPQFASNVCGDVANPEEIEGKIAMIYRGRCEFGTKSLNAQNAGAVAVIICNVPGAGNDSSSDGSDPISNGMGAGDDGANVTIPVLALGYQDCNRIVATIEAGTPVVGKIFLEESEGPSQVSSGFDNGIIFHEFGHGISSRLTGGPNQVCLGNDEQMGEGWSDFFTLALTVRPGEDGATPRPIGAYVQGEADNGRGIRRHPYSTDMSVNPQTYNDIKATTAPHPLGEVWVDMLWDIYWAYVDKYGYDADWRNTESGNFRAVQLVLDGMKMQGCNPGFIRGRNAILAAEEVNTGGENKCMIWEVFARRGLGFFADGGSENNRNDGAENFDPLPECLKTIKIYKSFPDLIEKDAQVNVELVVANHKDETVYDAVVSDEIPEGMSFVIGSSNVEAMVNGDQIFFEYDSLISQEWDTIRFMLQHDNIINSTVLLSNSVESDDEISEWERELIIDEFNIFRINSNTFFPTYSGENCWFVQELDDDTEASIRFNDIEVVGEHPVIRFWHRINTEFTRNGGFVEISTDGVLWNDARELFIRNGYMCPLAFTTFAIPAMQAFSGRTEEDEYVDSYIDLSDYKGQSISLRFRFGTNSGEGTIANDEVFPSDGGWFIDDIDLIDLVINNTEACITTSDDQACTNENVSIFDPQVVSSNEEIDLNFDGLKVYPNPANNFINLDFSSVANENGYLEILDVKGQSVYSENLQLKSGSSRFMNINTSAYSSGMYIIQFRTETSFYVQKVIIE